MQTVYQFTNQPLFRSLCGIADSEIDFLEQLLSVKLIPRGFSFVIQSDNPTDLNNADSYFAMLEKHYKNASIPLPERFDKEYLYHQMKNSGKDDSYEEQESANEIQDLVNTRILTNHKGKEILPRTLNQAAYTRAALRDSVVIAIGPAGTGKTFLSIAIACRMLARGEAERIILTRPAVEAGESLGFLPGDMAQKVDPYLRPVYDSLYEILGIEKVTEMITTGRIEIAPLAFMRGRTLNNSVVILDEAQNCTLAQLKMFLTRLGRNSKMFIGGDVTQIDLPPGRSGLGAVVSILRSTEGISVIEFGRRDIIRHPLVEKIVNAFESAERKN